MKRRSVIFSPRASRDLRSLFFYIARHGGVATAAGYVSRIESFCGDLDMFSERGRRLRGGVRVFTFEDSASIAVRVSPGWVRILAVAYRGRDLSKDIT